MVWNNKLFYIKSIGVVNDYYIAMAVHYLGVSDFPRKTFFWCSSSNWTFSSLPQPFTHLKHVYDKVQVYFSGEFDKVVISANGKSDSVDVQAAHAGVGKPLEIPKKGVSELDRLAYVVTSVESDCQVIPIGSFKMTPIKEVRRNEAF